MELSELTAYAGEKYHIEEQHKWADFPGFSVLCHPGTGRWLALLIRQWDGETGTQIECCDLKCGADCLDGFNRPYLAPPVRMKGSKWINVTFGNRTEREVVKELFDRAYRSEEPQGFAIELEAGTRKAAGAAGQQPGEETVYRDTPIPVHTRAAEPERSKLPERIRQMRHLYEYGSDTPEGRARNFYRQARFMEDYDDDYPWKGEFVCYFPTYHDMTTNQLRGYFTWRGEVRRGVYKPVPTSAAYVYIYELLNGIGASSPEDSLEKLRAFAAGYPGSGQADERMRQNLRRWMMEFAIIKELPPETAAQYADSELMERDRALTVLKEPGKYPDGEVFEALCFFGGKKLVTSPVLNGKPERGQHLFAEVWRTAQAHCREEDRKLFELCFGRRIYRRWSPLANAVCWKGPVREVTYSMNECRSYRMRDGSWQVSAYEKLSYDRFRFLGLVQEADRLLRRYLKTGRYLKENPANAWAVPFVRMVIAEDERAAAEAARPKITIDLTGLDRIRQDAMITRDSLLTEEEPELPGGAFTEEGISAGIFKEESISAGAFTDEFVSSGAEAPEVVAAPEEAAAAADLPLGETDLRILRALLKGESADAVLREARQMPSIAADRINEALYDEFGDTVIACEDDVLTLIEDYADDLAELLGR